MMRTLLTGALLFCLVMTGCTGQSPSATPPHPVSLLGEPGTGTLYGMLEAYYGLKDALVETNPHTADRYAQELIGYTDSLRQFTGTDSPHAIPGPLLDSIRNAGLAILSSEDESCEIKRIHFEKISDQLFLLLKQAGLKNAGVYRQYCPMAFNDRGAYWLSAETGIRNPYFGHKMLECGEIADTLN